MDPLNDIDAILKVEFGIGNQHIYCQFQLYLMRNMSYYTEEESMLSPMIAVMRIRNLKKYKSFIFP